MNEKRTIQRISLPSPDAFFADHLRPAQPVLIHDLFAGDSIREIHTADQAREAWGNETFRIRPEYVQRFMADRGVADRPAAPTQKLSLSEYFDFTKSVPDTNLLCTEEPVPHEIRQTFHLPEAVQSSLDPPITQLFVGKRGNHAHLHFDGDCRHGLLYQVYGRKRVLLVPAHMQPRMMPLGLISGWFVNRLSASERRALTDFLQGTWVTIEPGEALLIPAFTSHFVEYLDDAMSISLDFGRNPLTLRLHDEFPHTRHLQLAGCRLLDPDLTERRHPGFERELDALCVSLPRDPSVRRESLKRLASRLHGEATESTQLEELFLASQRDRVTDP